MRGEENKIHDGKAAAEPVKQGVESVQGRCKDREVSYESYDTYLCM